MCYEKYNKNVKSNEVKYAPTNYRLGYLFEISYLLLL